MTAEIGQARYISLCAFWFVGHRLPLYRATHAQPECGTQR